MYLRQEGELFLLFSCAARRVWGALVQVTSGGRREGPQAGLGAGGCCQCTGLGRPVVCTPVCKPQGWGREPLPHRLSAEAAAVPPPSMGQPWGNARGNPGSELSLPLLVRNTLFCPRSGQSWSVLPLGFRTAAPWGPLGH